MQKVYRFIFRLDFAPGYDLLDKPGQALKILMETPGAEYWTSVATAENSHILRSSYNDDRESKVFTVTPSTINGVYETADGIDLAKILENETFLTFSKLAHEYCDVFKLDKLTRMGLRVFVFEHYEEEYENYTTRFLNLLTPELMTAFASRVGQVEGARIQFDGVTNDEINYHLNFGFFNEIDYAKFTPTFAPTLLQEGAEFHTTVDIDLFETDISLKGLTLKNWSKDKWPIINTFLSILKDGLGAENVARTNQSR
jgi:hypothetical protein